MSLAVCLLLYSAAVLLFGPRVLRALTRKGHAPRFGVAAWMIAIASVVLTWFVASTLAIVDEIAHWNQRHSLINSCIEALCELLVGDSGSASRLVLLTVAAVLASAAAVAIVRLVRTFLRLRAHAHGHAQAIRLVGAPIAERTAFVVDADLPAAYCVAGHPSTIVVTSAAVAALDDCELRAVLAHEQAHVRGHHLQLTMLVHTAARVFSRLTLMRDGAAEVVRLLEMCADDFAVRRCGRRALLGGLRTLGAGAPNPALGAADIAVLSRTERLTLPPTPYLRAVTQAALVAATTLIAVTPLVAFGFAASGVLMCG